VDCGSGGELLGVEAVALIRSRVKRAVIAVIGVIVVGSIVVRNIVVGIVIVKSSLAAPAASSVDCVGGCDLGKVEALVVGSPTLFFAVVEVFAVVGVVISGVGKSSSTSAVRCVCDCGSWEMKVVAGVSPIFVFSAVSVVAVGGIGVGKIVFVIIVGTSSSTLSAVSVVGCGRC